MNAIATNDVAPLTSQEASLLTTISQIEEQVALTVLSKVAKNTYDDASDVIGPKDQSRQERALFNALIVFYSLLVPLQAA